MIRIQDILIPMRFSALMLQIIFSIVIIASKHDSKNLGDDKEFLAFWILFIIFEVAEFIIMLLGLTLFQNKLSLIQILLHVLSTALLAWYFFKEWETPTLRGIWIAGSLVPFLFELGGIFFTYLFYRKVLRLN